MYKKLLVAMDGSEVSLHAFKEALRISRTDVLVLSVAPPYSGDLRVVGTDLGEPFAPTLPGRPGKGQRSRHGRRGRDQAGLRHGRAL